MNAITTHRDSKGRFMAGNAYAADGGRARAAKLPPARRREIAQAGFRALVARRFDGDRELAKRYVGKVGAWAGDAYRGTRWQHFAHPGSIEAFHSRTKPFDTLKTKPFDTLKTKPFDTLKTKPFDTLKTKPFDTLKTKPFDTLKTKPFDTLKTKPTEGGTA